MSFQRALWLIPAAILVHNAEEYPKMVSYAKRRCWEISETQWRVALAIMTLAPTLMTAISALAPKESRRSRLALTIPFALSLNALDHLRQTIWYRDYSPGTATGIGINIPVSLYIYRRALREKRLSTGSLALIAGAGLVIFGVMLPVSHETGKLAAKLLDGE